MKRSISQNFWISCLIACLGIAPACAGGKKKPEESHAPAAVEASTWVESSDEPSLLWSKKLEGLITDLNVSKKGNAILVASNMDPDRPGGQKRPNVSLFNSKGKQLWSRGLSSSVKSQAISDDGSLAVVTQYDEQIEGIDAAGKSLWSVPGGCRPIVFSTQQRILCYHEDATEPSIAFDVLDWKGKTLMSHRVTSDVLSLKIASDERHFAMAQTRGQVTLFGGDFKVKWQKKVEGEVLDVAVSSTPNPWVAVLASSSKNGQRVYLFDNSGKVKAAGVPRFKSEQIEIAPGAQGIFAYGNSSSGQRIEYFKWDPAKSLAPMAPVEMLQSVWIQGDPRYANYTIPIQVGHELMVMGMEYNSPQTRSSMLLGFDSSGKLKWHLPLKTEEGAYLYSHAIPEAKPILVVGTDDSMLSVYSIE